MKRLFFILIVLAASVPSVVPLFHPGYFPMHDDTQVARVIEMGKALREGQFPVRMVRDLGYGYGYPIFNFYGPLPYYVGGFFTLVGFDALTATKVMMGLGMLLAAVSMYAFVSKILPFWGTIALATLYTYAPYHGLNLYVRGAVGELWAYGFLPLVVAGLLGNIPLGILGLFGVVTSHTIIGYITVGLLVTSYVLRVIFSKNRRIVWPQEWMIFFSLGLSAFFWLPAIMEMRFTNVIGQIGGGADFRDHFVCLLQLWDSPLGYGGSIPGCIDGMSFKLGKLHILLGVAGFLLFIKNWKRSQKQLRWVRIIETLLVVGSVFFMTPLSKKLWEIIPYAAFIQYPWRLLTFAILGLVLLSGILWRDLKSGIGAYIGLVVIVLAIVVNAESFLPQYIYPTASADFESEYELRFRASGVSDEYLPPSIVRPKEESEVVFDTIAGRRLEETATFARYVVESTAASEIVVRKAYFPGWRYWINNQEVIPRIEGGLPVFALEPGQSVIELAFTDTPIRTIGNMVSLVSLLMLGWKLYDNQRKAKR